jgi:drug/metabolite transporter (DMT)-like permease
LLHHPQLKAYLALAAVCFFWGTTYVAIRMALESMSPMVLVSARYLLSGGIMFLAALAMRVHLPRGRELRRTALNGLLVLGVGNGCLAFAEQWIPSGMAALFISISPFWMVGMEALVPGGEKLHGPTIGGMLIGFAGAAMLVWSGAAGISGAMVAGFLILQLGSAGWSLGSILQRRQVSNTHPVVSGAIQQLATGIVALIPAAFTIRNVELSARGSMAVLYLVIFGSIVGYSAYIYAMSELPVAVVSIYTYINPIVAVWLGWLFYREPFGGREAVAMGVIFLGVAMVKRYSRPAAPVPQLSGRPAQELSADGAADRREEREHDK